MFSLISLPLVLEGAQRFTSYEKWGIHGRLETFPSNVALTELLLAMSPAYASRGKSSLSSVQSDQNGEVFMREGLAQASRRTLLKSASLAAVAAGTLHSGEAIAGDWYSTPEASKILQWVSKDAISPGETTFMERVYTLPFITYLARFLLNYDRGSGEWWDAQILAIPSSIAEIDQLEMRNRSFSQFSASVSYGLRRYCKKNGPEILLESLIKQYGGDAEACRHLAIAFSCLQEDEQPVAGIERLLKKVQYRRLNRKSAASEADDVSVMLPPSFSPALPDYLARDPKRLLPSTIVPIRNERGFYEIRGLQPMSNIPRGSEKIDVVNTVFGPRGGVAKGERALGLIDFASFSLAGAIGCAGTHSVVIPLDVVKTRLQTSPGRYDSISDGFGKIFKEEGLGGLFLGAVPTMLGYIYYGATVYPGFEFFRRLFESILGPVASVTFHAPVVLLGGAASTVIACFGVCPAEVVRIRMVSKPQQYGNGNNIGEALGTISAEAAAAKTSLVNLLYAGFRPLVIRQVIFGMIKFFTYDLCVDAILSAYPDLVDSRSAVAFVAGLIAGVASSIISQPADTVLSRMNRGAQDTSSSEAPDLFDTVRAIFDEYGPSGFFLGTGTRVLWAGSIIAGQFFFYDLAKTMLSVDADSLTAVLDVNL